MPAHTSRISSGGDWFKNLAVAARFRKEDASTIFAPAQARKARVPLVVVLTMVLPRTFSGAELARRIAEIEINAAGLRGADFHAVALAGQQHVRLTAGGGRRPRQFR